MDSHGLEAFCLDAQYISAFDILNLPSLAIPDIPQQLSSNLSWLARSNITAYTSDPASILLNNFKYSAISLPLAKPLAIQCPVPACVFPISGYFTFLQRLLYTSTWPSLSLPFTSPSYKECLRYGSRHSGSACWQCI